MLTIREFHTVYSEIVSEYIDKLIRTEVITKKKSSKNVIDDFGDEPLYSKVLQAITWAASLNFGELFNVNTIDRIYNEPEHHDFLVSTYNQFQITCTDLDMGEYINFVTETLLNNPINPVMYYEKETNEFIPVTYYLCQDSEEDKKLYNKCYEELLGILENHNYILFLITLTRVNLNLKSQELMHG